MSESVSNNSESYSAPSRKYSGYSGRNSESPSAPTESPANSYTKPVNNNNNKENNIKKARIALKETETFLLKRTEVIQNHAYVLPIQNCIRSIAVDNEEQLLALPFISTILSCYEQIHNKLTSDQKEEPINKILFDGLKEVAENERRNNSTLKYW